MRKPLYLPTYRSPFVRLSSTSILEKNRYTSVVGKSGKYGGKSVSEPFKPFSYRFINSGYSLQVATSGIDHSAAYNAS